MGGKFAGIVGLLCATLSLARADVKPVGNEHAMKLYAEGKEAYEQMKYQLAFDRFKAAYTLTHQTELLFNMAAAEQGLGHPRAAADLLRVYLMITPDDPDRTGIERRIRALEDQPPSPSPPPRPPPPPPPPPAPQVVQPELVVHLPPPPPRWFRDPAGHVLFFGGIAVLAAGGALLGLGNMQATDLGQQRNYGDYLSARDGARALQYGGVALLGVGGAIALGGLVRYIVVGRRAR
jgi:tetratricopeptide (TPR) repeat protein